MSSLAPRRARSGGEEQYCQWSNARLMFTVDHDLLLYHLDTSCPTHRWWVDSPYLPPTLPASRYRLLYNACSAGRRGSGGGCRPRASRRPGRPEPASAASWRIRLTIMRQACMPPSTSSPAPRICGSNSRMRLPRSGPPSPHQVLAVVQGHPPLLRMNARLVVLDHRLPQFAHFPGDGDDPVGQVAGLGIAGLGLPRPGGRSRRTRPGTPGSAHRPRRESP